MIELIGIEGPTREVNLEAEAARNAWQLGGARERDGWIAGPIRSDRACSCTARALLRSYAAGCAGCGRILPKENVARILIAHTLT